MRQLIFVLSFFTGYIAHQEQLPINAQAGHVGHDLTVKEIVEILSEFNVNHTEQQPFFQPAYGVTNFESTPPAIWIFTTADMRSRKGTVIHELLHVHYRNVAMDVPEEFIRSEEDRLYQKLFGVTP